MPVSARILKEYDKFTKTQKKVADYIFDNFKKAAMQTSTEIALAVGVSNTTVIRFAYALQFASFSEMQHHMKQDVLDLMEASGPRSEDAEDASDLTREIDATISILKEYRDGFISCEQLQGIAKRIVNADCVMIFGYYGEHTVSFELYLLLDSIKENVYYFRSTNEGYRNLVKLTEDSVIIACSAKPYSPGTLRVAREAARTYHSYLISFTDSALCELAMEADENVLIKINSFSEGKVNFMAPVFLIFDLLFKEVYKADPEGANKRLAEVPSQLVHPANFNHF